MVHYWLLLRLFEAVHEVGLDLMNVIIVHNHIPKPDLAGCDLRLMQVIDAFVDTGHQVVFVSLWPSVPPLYAISLRSRGISVFDGDAERLVFHGVQAPNRWVFKDIIRSRKFDLVVLTLWFWHNITIPEHYFNEIAACTPGVPICTLTDDRHGLRQLQRAMFSKSFLTRESSNDYSAREREAYRRSDIVATIAAAEASTVEEMAPGVPTSVIPFSSSVVEGVSTFDERDGFLFLANFSNIAAREGLKWFLELAWPILRTFMPTAEMTVAGVMSRECAEYKVQGINVLGHISDLKSLFARHRVFISPIPYGTGVVTKNVTAMAHGLPIVTTTSGSVSLKMNPGVDGFIADTAEEIAQYAAQVYSDKNLWERLSKAGAKNVTENFPSENVLRGVDSLMRLCMAIPPRVRRAEPWSARAIDCQGRHLERTSPLGGYERGRIVSYIARAEGLLADGDFDNAISQYRHACSIPVESWKGAASYGRLLLGLEKCYERTEDLEGLDRCKQEIRRTLDLTRHR